MRTLVWGAGAIGGTLGAYLARSGRDVTMVDIDVDHVETIARAGIRVTGPIDEFTVRVPACTPAALGGVWDEIILATKAHHTDAAVRALAPHLSDGGHVISAQNGLNELVIAAVVGPERTIGAFVNFGADNLEPGVVHVGGRGAVVIGELDGRGTTRAAAIRDAWSAFDGRAAVTSNICGPAIGSPPRFALPAAPARTAEAASQRAASTGQRWACKPTAAWLSTWRCRQRAAFTCRTRSTTRAAFSRPRSVRGRWPCARRFSPPARRRSIISRRARR